MPRKIVAVGALSAAAFVAIQSPGVALAVLTVAGLLYWTVVSVGSSARRGPMIASGVIVAGLIAGDLAFGHDIALFGLPGFLVASALALGVDTRRHSVEVAAMIVYWLVNTAIFGMLIARVYSLIAQRRARHATTLVTLASALALGVAGCLTDTPPKTPNQRDAERNAPVVAVPPPPDAGRTPRPAPQ